MRYLTKLLLFCCFLLITRQLFASPLIFKATKVITTNDLVELGSFDATKYRQIRIAIKLLVRPHNTVIITKSVALIELNFAKRELRRQLDLFQQGVTSKASYDLSEETLQTAQRNYDNALENVYFPATIIGLDDGEEIPLGIFEKLNPANSIVIETPPSKIKIQVFGKGTYKLLVWGVL